MRSLWLQLMTLEEINSELGMMIEILSLVIMVVARAEIRTTSPLVSPTSMRSPTLMGRSKRMMSPEMKLLVTFCQAKTDTNTQCTGQNAQGTQVNTRRTNDDI